MFIPGAGVLSWCLCLYLVPYLVLVPVSISCVGIYIWCRCLVLVPLSLDGDGIYSKFWCLLLVPVSIDGDGIYSL